MPAAAGWRIRQSCGRARVVRWHGDVRAARRAGGGRAAARSGAIEVPVHPAYRGPLLEHILAEPGERILVCDAELLPRLRDLAPPALERVVMRVTGELDSEQVPPGVDRAAHHERARVSIERGDGVEQRLQERAGELVDRRPVEHEMGDAVVVLDGQPRT
ncbi:hypothetical protein [Conexibacter sp. CPCC 206217]|uniref:hypothetical protein n=1 Tax=Conexibacter sp. CPCC 206217 TaxID=3064574 RepID=UPI00272751CA|nr:hypothetical protein [Conexibacter sp. CPCC 206217]MDO8209712.1 hypothetical protein [Conexibacter sp. CPCC 206217]